MSNLPVILVIDTSFYMKDKLDIVSKGLKILKEKLVAKENNWFEYINVEIAIITSGDKIPTKHDFLSIDDFYPLEILETNNDVSIDASIQEALDMMKSKVRHLDAYRDPEIFIITDVDSGLELDKYVRDEKLYDTYISFFIGGIKEQTMKDLLKRNSNPKLRFDFLNQDSFDMMIRRMESKDEVIITEADIEDEDKVIIKEADIDQWSTFDHKIVDDQKETNYSIEKTNLIKPFMFGTSITGPGHIKDKIVCQDACTYDILSLDIYNELCIFAVADGLGSAKKSDIGSKLAVESALDTGKEIAQTYYNECFDCRMDDFNFEQTLKLMVASSRESLEKKALEINCQLRDLACTLIVGLFLRGKAGVAHIGDGAVVANIDGNLVVISKPGESEYVNIVTPLTSEKWEQETRINPNVENVGCMAAFTDGCQRAVLLKRENELIPYDKFFIPLFNYGLNLSNLNEGISDLEELLSSQMLSENSEDDKTLVVLIS